MAVPTGSCRDSCRGHCKGHCKGTYGPDTVHALAVEIARLQRRTEGKQAFRLGLVAAGIGVSGVVNQRAMSIELSYALHIYSPLPLKAALQSVLDVPILLLNDAQATALGEAERSDGNILLAIVECRPGGAADDIGVGVGLVIEGKLVQGHSISHLLRPKRWERPLRRERPNQDEGCADNPHFIDNLARSLALLANTMGVDDVILGGDAANTAIYDELTASIIRYCTGGNPSGNPSRNIRVRPGF